MPYFMYKGLSRPYSNYPFPAIAHIIYNAIGKGSEVHELDAISRNSYWIQNILTTKPEDIVNRR